MKANETQLHIFMGASPVRFRIPVYQRNYDWTEKHCAQLLDDILLVGGRPAGSTHFMGSVVFVHDSVSTIGGMRELTIIDGQQRLTTVSLIFAALIHAGNIGREPESIRDQFLMNLHVPRESALKIWTSPENRVILERIIESGEPPVDVGYSRLVKNFEFIRDRIASLDPETMLRGLERIMVVEIGLDRERDNPQEIFESLNSTGLGLTDADLIRNYIMMGLPGDRQERVHANIWLPMGEFTWNAEKGASMMPEFFRDFLTMRNGAVCGRRDVYASFKKMYPDPLSPEADVWHGELLDAARVYSMLINPSSAAAASVASRLENLKMIPNNVYSPFVMRVLLDRVAGRIEDADVEKILGMVESYVARRFFVGLQSSAMNRVFAAMCGRLSKENGGMADGDYVAFVENDFMARRGVDKFPTDSEMRASLKTLDVNDRNMRNFIFHRIENHGNNEVVDVMDSAVTFEHVFPRNPGKEWSDDLTEEEFRLMESRVDTIGNLTLSGNNGALSNRGFTAKRDMNENGGEQGYRYSRLWLNRGLAKIDRWDPVALDARCAKITNRILDIWPSPPRPGRGGGNIEVSISEGFDPTDMTVVAARLMGNDLDVRNFRSLHREVTSWLLREFPDRFHGTGLGAKLRLTKDESSLNRSHPVGEGWFVEVNFSGRDVFRILEDVFAALEIGDALTVVLKDGRSEG